MARGMKIIAALSFLAAAVFASIYQIKPFEIFLTLAITAATVFYHFIMRLLVGGIFDRLMNNKADLNKKWFQITETEQRFYDTLKLKKWKKHLPTYDPSVFDTKQHTLDEIAKATCQAELVHETIAVLSFLPIVASIWFGAPAVFVITSVISALFDLVFAALQRYNRPRLLKIINSRK